ncbi:MAG: hemerythrin domain-containing protein [Actinomycetota bacterium]
MTSNMQPLRDEHAEMRMFVEALLIAADRIGHEDLEIVLRGIDGALDFLQHHLIPHAETEERVLYPAVCQVLHDPLATATMTMDHEAIIELTDQLAVARARISGDGMNLDDADILRRVLYGLYALVSLHVSKEEVVFMPLLEENRTNAEAQDLIEQMHPRLLQI